METGYLDEIDDIIDDDVERTQIAEIDDDGNVALRELYLSD